LRPANLEDIIEATEGSNTLSLLSSLDGSGAPV
jgi:hypothetical protein